MEFPTRPHGGPAVSLVKLLVSFAPWIAFLIIARDSMARVEIGLVAALALSVVMAVLKLHRGVIMWVGLVFFTAATVAVLGFHSVWAVRHLGVLANGALALGSWITLAIGKPFTLEYARAHTDPSKWNNPQFIRVNVLLTSVWATVFTVNAVLAWTMMKHLLTELAGHTASYVTLIGAAVFTSWYPKRVRAKRSAV
ncbi:hypothetical protein BST42_03085 [Mycolicibacterium rhodesiae]|uniref:Intracellular septation protein A n=1 Tax=Mycolicibacterium rhodesiae TaxID=36814 RepID=A0A1X0J6H9_MYCRH|nr:hypothetical protein [Mycolicibacterium rhodesiae]ORB57376.1 hypothetical protein BST42_03085 [Mycolicibacterium rhodesiae]